MVDIVVYNIIFWTAWIGISHLPQYVFQKMIDNYNKV